MAIEGEQVHRWGATCVEKNLQPLCVMNTNVCWSSKRSTRGSSEQIRTRLARNATSFKNMRSCSQRNIFPRKFRSDIIGNRLLRDGGHIADFYMMVTIKPTSLARLAGKLPGPNY